MPSHRLGEAAAALTSHTTRTVSAPTASEELAILDERRAEVGRRISELDQAERAAHQELRDARAVVVDLERRGGTPAERAELEKALRAAEARASEPWRQRIEGARAAARDADAERRRFIGEHLDELVEEREAVGAECAAQINEHLGGLIVAYHAWNQVAQEIIGLASSVAALRPGDVSRTKSEAVVREANALIMAGGEQGPRLKFDPREPRHSQIPAQVPA
jgi:chromosome segregation ATPase